MILQALKSYYDRKAAEPDSDIAPAGWVASCLDYIINIDLDGNYRGIECVQEIRGKKVISKPMILPNIGKQALKHSNSGKDANLLWDNTSFVLGLGPKGDLKIQSMIAVIDDWFPNSNNPEIKAVKAFLSKGFTNRKHFYELTNHKDSGEAICSGQPKVSFRVHPSEHPVIFESPEVKELIRKRRLSGENNKDEILGVCLITGEQHVPIELTHSVIKGVWKAQSSGATIIGFNQDSFLSYGKKQSANAPVGKDAASAYVKALNYLLSSKQRMQVGDASTVFWSERKTRFESDFAFFFSEPPKDDPSAGTDRIRNLFDSVNTGAYQEDTGDERFFVLGLSPNIARIAVRFWQVGTVSEFAGRIRQHFDDLRLCKPPREPEYYSLWRLLVNIATQDESKNIPPNIGGDFMRSILTGAPYPASLLQAALRRIKSDTERRVTPVRAALIKAYLNRYYRKHSENKYKEITMALDVDQQSIGYQIGRLFAVLEKIQEEANPGLNSTIRERFYSSACSSPVTVFATLLRLKNHHLAKLENRGRAVNFERLIGEIVGRISDFPAHLDMHEQGRFAIGYYHQRQNFFEKREKTDQEKGERDGIEQTV